MVEEAPLTATREGARRQLHRDADEIIRAWPHALEDALADRYPHTNPNSEHRGSVGDHSDPTANAATRASHAVAWIAELGDILTALHVDRTPRLHIAAPLHAALDDLAWMWPDGARLRRRIERLADAARRDWPPRPKKGDQIGGVTVGQRTNEIGNCHLCGDPVAPGNGPQGRRWVQHPVTGERLEFHKSPCWYDFQRGRQTPSRPPTAVDEP